MESEKIVLKIIVFGPPASGSKSLIDRYTINKFSYDYKLTTGVNFAIKDIKLKNGQECTLQIWDMGAQSRFEHLRGKFMVGYHGAILLFDLTNPESWNNILPWYYELRYLNINAPLVLVGTQLHKIAEGESERGTNPSVISRWAKDRAIPYYEYNKKSGEGVECFDKIAEMVVYERLGIITPRDFKYKDMSLAEDEFLQILDFKMKKKIPRLEDNQQELSFGYRSKENRITELGLEGCKLNSIPNSLANLTQLEVLNLNENYLKDIPPELHKMEKLQELHIGKNPLKSEVKKLVFNIQNIRKYCRGKSNINLFISYSLSDVERFHLDELVRKLERHEGIGTVFYFNTTQVGEIGNYMASKIPQAQLILFIASDNSLNSAPCRREIQSAKDHEIPILPFLDTSLKWSDPRIRQLGLHNYRGVPTQYAEHSDMRLLWNELFELIDKQKKEFNLHEPVEEKIDILLIELNAFLKQQNIKELLKQDQEFTEVIEGYTSNTKSKNEVLNYLFTTFIEKIKDNDNL